MPRSTKQRIPLSFTYTIAGYPQTYYDLKNYKRINSRESLGVWVIDDWAWKVFSEEKQFARVQREYKTVKDHGLLDPRTFWTQVTVNFDDKTRSQGFAIASPFIDVKHTYFCSFDLKNGTGSLESIIKKKVNDINALKRIYQAFQVAEQLGIADPQGFVDTNPDNRTPVVFIDIHLRTTSSRKVVDIRRFLGQRIQDK